METLERREKFHGWTVSREVFREAGIHFVAGFMVDFVKNFVVIWLKGNGGSKCWLNQVGWLTC